MRKSYYTSDRARQLGYRSGFEDQVGEFLKSQGIVFEYESTNCKINYYKPIPKGVLVDVDWTIQEFKGKVCQSCEYTVDFYIPGRYPIWIETKGYFKSEDRTKHKLIKQQHPGLDIRILFQRDNQATPNLSYLEWCEKHDITAAVINKKNKIYVPEEWLNELS